MPGFCEHCNEPQGSIKGVEFLGKLKEYQRKEDSVP
jgi:hypothetical protein